MADKVNRRERYSDGFALTRFTLPVIWQMSKVIPGGFFIYHEDEKRELIYANDKVCEIYGCANLDEFKEQIRVLSHGYAVSVFSGIRDMFRNSKLSAESLKDVLKIYFRSYVSNLSSDTARFTGDI